MKLLPDQTPLPPHVDSSGDGEDLSPSGPEGCRDTQPLDPAELRSEMIAAFRGDSDSPGSSASARDTLCAAITHLSSVIEQLENLYRSAESIDDKIKLSSALGIATVRLSTLLRTQKYLALDQSSELYEEIQQAIYTVNKEWGRI